MIRPPCRLPRAILSLIAPAMLILMLMGVLTLILSDVCQARETHPVSVSRCFVFVAAEKMDVRLQVFLEDLFLFHDLKPDGQDFLTPDVIQEGIERHKSFLLNRLSLRDTAGLRLEGRAVGVQSKLPTEGVRLGELMAHTLTFEFEYEVLAPEFLTISHHFTDDEGIIPSEMNVFVRQESSGLTQEATLKPDEQETFRLGAMACDVDDPVADENRETWLARQKEETLGITSYSSVYSFLYIEPYEVRHEILIPLITLESSVLIARDDDDWLDLAEQAAARQQIEAYFASGNPIAVDGETVRPVVQRCDFFGLDFKDFAKRAEAKPVSLATARVGIILSYPTQESPAKVELTWNRFSNYVWSVNMTVFAFSETLKATLSRIGQQNVWSWVNPGQAEVAAVVEVDAPPPSDAPLVVAVVSSCLAVVAVAVMSWMLQRRLRTRPAVVRFCFVAGCAAGIGLAIWSSDHGSKAAAPSAALAESVFGRLHSNIYRAFDYRDESQIYDALAKSIDGPLLRDVYLQVQRGLVMQEQGGAVSRVRRVQLVTGEMQPLADDSDGFHWRCRWNVEGTVEHWGHIHARTNQYEAFFDVRVRSGCWKITGLRVLDEQRLGFETSLRG